MKLAAGEKSVLATFPSSTKAQKAKNEMQQMGISEIQVDRISRFGVELDTQYNNPLAGQADTETGLTLFSADHDQLSNNDARILEAADPSNYSMALKDYGIAGGDAFLLTAVTNEEKLQQAVNIVKENGGKV